MRVAAVLAIVVAGVGSSYSQTKVDYPTQVKNGPVVVDVAYATLSEGCAAAVAAHAALNITKDWLNVPTTICNVVVNFTSAAAVIQPASTATFTVNGYTGINRQIVWDLSVGGSVRLNSVAAGTTIYAGNFSTFGGACETAAAAAIIGASPLAVNGPITVSTDTTCAATVSASAGGVISVNTGVTLTVTGAFSGDRSQHFIASGTAVIILSGTATPVGQWFGAVGDGVTDDTAAITAALKVAMASAKPLYFPAATYMVCGAAVVGTGPLTVYGDGAQLSMIEPVGGSCTGSMIQATMTGDVFTMHDIGMDGMNTTEQAFLGNNITIVGSGTTNQLVGPDSVTVYNVYMARAKSVGFQCQPCQNVSITNSTFYKNYWFGISLASSGTTASPLYLHNINIHGNTFIDEAIGAGISFFLSNMSVTGNVFRQSGLELVQTPHAQATIDGNSFDGVPDQGCIVASGGGNTCGSLSGIWAPLYFEGASEWTLGVNHIVNINGSAAVLNASGSTLTIPLITGTQMELPTSNAHVDGLVIEKSTAGFPLLIGGTSNGSNPIIGVNVTVKNTKLYGVNECPNIGGIIGFEVGNNFCDTATNGGFLLGNVQNGTLDNNTCRNCNVAAGTTYTTGTLSATNGSATLTGSGTTWIGGMVGGGITIAGTTYEILSRSSNTSIILTVPYAGTSGSGLTYSIHYAAGGSFPCFQISGTGTHAVQIDGNTCLNDFGNSVLVGINDNTGLDPSVSLIRYDTTNTCSGPCGNGLYTPTPVLRPTLSSCGSGSAIASTSTNYSGLIIPGTGANESCTITFMNSGFTTGPSCSFTGNSSNVYLIGAMSGLTKYVLASTGVMDSQDISYSCSGTSASAGWYPYP